MACNKRGMEMKLHAPHILSSVVCRTVVDPSTQWALPTLPLRQARPGEARWRKVWLVKSSLAGGHSVRYTLFQHKYPFLLLLLLLAVLVYTVEPCLRYQITQNSSFFLSVFSCGSKYKRKFCQNSPPPTQKLPLLPLFPTKPKLLR